MKVNLKDYKYTDYFEKEVLKKRPYIRKEWCHFVLENPVRYEIQESGRVRYWAFIDEFGRRALRVVTLEDGITIHNAFFDRNFKKE
jgi:hypothetical protein